MATYEEQIFPGFEAESLCCRPASHASQAPAPASAEVRAMTVGSGRQCSMWLSQSDPLGAFSKILLESSAWTSSGEYCYVWSRLDTKFGCSAFQLTPLGQSTEDSGCSLWPTAHANCSMGAGTQGRDGGINLQTAVKLWPTPNGGNFNDGEDLENWEARRQKNKEKFNNGNGQGTPLAIAAKLWPTPRKEGYDAQGKGHGDLVYEVKNRLWPTPTGRDYKDGQNVDNVPVNSLLGRAVNPSPSQGSLNPRFVEELMGFEVGHTDLKHWETLSFRSRPIPSLKRLHRSKTLDLTF